MPQRDFTLKIYKSLLIAFKQANYTFLTFEQFLTSNQLPKKVVILRHDVDLSPQNALKMAEIEKGYGIKSTYFFRIIKRTYKPEIIKKIADLEHEVGYHYEDFSLAKGNYEKAIELFWAHLTNLREFYPVKTICMHGSPLSKWDNKSIWDKYDYRDFGIIGEPYFDIDFNEVLYLTDTGRSWNGGNVSIRDFVKTDYSFEIESTFDLIDKIQTNKLPDKILLNTHPIRWNDKYFPWLRHLIWQNTKNIGKVIFLKLKKYEH